jgi:hypothetical protein
MIETLDFAFESLGAVIKQSFAWTPERGKVCNFKSFVSLAPFQALFVTRLFLYYHLQCTL